jgi:hypothetical protein
MRFSPTVAAALLFLLPAARAGAQPPTPVAGVVQVGQVAIVEGNDETIDSTSGPGQSVRLAVIARKVIESFGDHFQAMTVWVTFDEASNPGAEAYELTVKADVRGIGIAARDNSRAFGSAGTLRSILNMKRVWRRVEVDTLEAWRPHLETWGQESGHRWLIQMLFRDPRTGRLSDAMLGRDCAHYSRFVDTQGSVQDGVEWIDNRNGTFTQGPRSGTRFGNLDLYGMGLMAADELPPFFLIDDIPGYSRPPCASYFATARPMARTISGTRVDIGAADIIAAHGQRVPAAYELQNGLPQDYFREAQVVVTRPGETVDDRLAQQLAARIDKARLFWEEWMRVATDRRMVVCTQLVGDCGDPRSDVETLTVDRARRGPAAGPLTVEVGLYNGGDKMSTGVEASLTTELAGLERTVARPVGSLAPKSRQTVSMEVDARGTPCGTPMVLKALTQSDFHRHRMRRTMFVGAESVTHERFEAESGWKVNPEGTDTTMGAIWERGTPQASEIISGKPAQPAGAHDGQGAFVTGLATTGARDPYVRLGRTTLESPVFDATTWREPRMRYWFTLFGVKAGASSAEVVPSNASRLLVLARALPPAGGAPNGGAPGGNGDAGTAGPWVEVDRLEGLLNDQWTERIALLPAALEGTRFQLRFVAEDGNPEQGGVEAGIDDVELFSNVPACYEPPPVEGRKGGGGCALGTAGAGAGTGNPGLLAGALVLALAFSRRRARRRR